MNSVDVYSYYESLCLIKYGDDYFFAYLELPRPEWTLKRYNEWCAGYIQNALPLSGDYVPQRLPLDRIRIVCVLEEELRRYSLRYDVADNELRFSFHELYNRCWNSKWPVQPFCDYIEEKFKEASEKRKKAGIDEQDSQDM